jgi:hypothetical protein
MSPASRPRPDRGCPQPAGRCQDEVVPSPQAAAGSRMSPASRPLSGRGCPQPAGRGRIEDVPCQQAAAGSRMSPASSSRSDRGCPQPSGRCHVEDVPSSQVAVRSRMSPALRSLSGRGCPLPAGRCLPPSPCPASLALAAGPQTEPPETPSPHGRPPSRERQTSSRPGRCVAESPAGAHGTRRGPAPREASASRASP